MKQKKPHKKSKLPILTISFTICFIMILSIAYQVHTQNKVKRLLRLSQTTLQEAEKQTSEKTKLYNLALTYAKDATEIDPDNRGAWVHLGDIYTQLIYSEEDAEKNALSAYEKAFTARKDVDTYHEKRGVLFYHTHNYHKALLELEQAEELNNKNFNAHYYSAQTYKKLGNTAKAKDIYLSMLELFADHPEREKIHKELNSL